MIARRKARLLAMDPFGHQMPRPRNCDSIRRYAFATRGAVEQTEDEQRVGPKLVLNGHGSIEATIQVEGLAASSCDHELVVVKQVRENTLAPVLAIEPSVAGRVLELCSLDLQVEGHGRDLLVW
jgi:hypothetical protein